MRAHPVDTQAEADVARYLEQAWDCTLTRMPRYSRVDWLAHRGGTCGAVVEIKCRTHTPDTYPTLMLSASKWVSVRDVADALSVRGLVVVRFADGSTRCLNLAISQPVDIHLGGRTDRHEPNDIEPCVYLPMTEMLVVTP